MLEFLKKFQQLRCTGKSSRPLIALVFSLLLHSSILGVAFFLGEPRVGIFTGLEQQSILFFNAGVTDTSAIEDSGQAAESLDTKELQLLDKNLDKVSPKEFATFPQAGTGPATTERFYSVAEVSQAAIPYSDWIVPWEVLKEARVKEFVVQLWILETGEVLQADVLRITPMNVSVTTKDELSTWLTKTRTTPAQRDGRPVASVRTIEVTLEL